MEQQIFTEPGEEFASDLRQAGFLLENLPIMDGSIQRVRVEGDRGRKLSGAYSGYLDGRPAGWYQNHKIHDRIIKWTSKGKKITPTEQAKIRAEAKQKKEKREEQRQRKYVSQSRRVTQVYNLMPAASPTNKYLATKGVDAFPGVKEDKQHRLVIPLVNISGQITSLQRISPNGFKNLKKNAQKTGSFFVVGKEDLQDGEPILYAEGFSTAATVAMATNRPVVAAIDSGNLPVVAGLLKDKYPNSQHLILGDDDHKNKENKGRLKAEEAANKANGVYLLPLFTQDEITKGYSDFNDIQQTRGLKEVEKQVETILKEMKTETPKRTSPEPDISQNSQVKKVNTVEPVKEREQGEKQEDISTSESGAQRTFSGASEEDKKKNLQQSVAAETNITASAVNDTEKVDSEKVLEIPASVKKLYVEHENKYYFANQTTSLAFVDKGLKLQTKLDSNKVAASMVDIAQVRGWEEIRVKGTTEFRRQVWLAGIKKDLTVVGYNPQKEDIVLLKQLKQSKQLKREVEEEKTMKLHSHGSAPFKNDPKNSNSYFVTLEDQKGKLSTRWGVGLRAAMQDSDAKKGDTIEIEHLGRQPVTVTQNVKNKNGDIVDKKTIETHRNSFLVKVKAKAIRDKTQDHGELIKEHPDLVNEIAAVKVAEKFSHKLPEGKRDLFMTKVRDRVATNIEQEKETPKIKINERVKTRTIEKEDEAEI